MPQVRSCLVSVLVLSSLCAIVVQTAPMTKTSIDSIRTSNLQNQASIEDTESLPPDTFRKLAQALYQRGDKVLDRKRFHNESVTCNDGSVAGYYIRRNRHSKRWIIFLEGKKLRMALEQEGAGAIEVTALSPGSISLSILVTG